MPNRRRTIVARVLLATFAVWGALPVTVARAQGAPSKDVAPAAQKHARAEFERGIDRYDRKDYAGALAAFVAAHDAQPVPSLRRNIALCLRALHREPEAIEQLERMLEESGANLKPDVKSAVDKAIAEMHAELGSVRVSVTARIGGGVSSPMPMTGQVAVDGLAVPRDKLARALCLKPGAHHVVAQAPGYADAARAITVVAGKHDVPVALELIPIAGAPPPSAAQRTGSARLRVTTNVPDAVVAVDGVPIATGGWEGELPSGNHRVEVTARGYMPFGESFDLPNGVDIEVPVQLGTMISEVAKPAVDDVEPSPPLRERNWQLLALLALHLGSRAQSVALGEDPAGPPGTVRGYPGGAIAVKGARKLGRYFSVEVLGELGTSRPKAYDVDFDDAGTRRTGRSDVRANYLAVVPGFRVRTPGTIRFVGGLALGVEHQDVDARLGDARRRAKGLNYRATAEAGAQLQLSPLVFLELGAFVDLYGVHAVRDPDHGRVFLDSPALRGGLRGGVGFEL